MSEYPYTAASNVVLGQNNLPWGMPSTSAPPIPVEAPMRLVAPAPTTPTPTPTTTPSASILTDRGHQLVIDLVDKHISGELNWKRTAASILVPIAVYIEYGFLWAIAAFITGLVVDALLP